MSGLILKREKFNPNEDKLFIEYPMLELLFSFLNYPAPLNDTLAGYFNKTI